MISDGRCKKDTHASRLFPERAVAPFHRKNICIRNALLAQPAGVRQRRGGARHVGRRQEPVESLRRH
jgi:hypothetical protein